MTTINTAHSSQSSMSRQRLSSSAGLADDLRCLGQNDATTKTSSHPSFVNLPTAAAEIVVATLPIKIDEWSEVPVLALSGTLTIKKFLRVNSRVEVGGMYRFSICVEGGHNISASRVDTLACNQHCNSMHFGEHIALAFTSDWKRPAFYSQFILKLV